MNPDLLDCPYPTHTATEGVVVGKLVAFDNEGRPLVTFDGCRQPVTAGSVVVLGRSNVGFDLVLAFEQGETRRPIVLGILQHAPTDLAGGQGDPQGVSVEADGDRVAISAKKEIVLRCGKASITLTRAGKILIRGAYLLNRSSGVNRVKGASVQIN